MARQVVNRCQLDLEDRKRSLQSIQAQETWQINEQLRKGFVYYSKPNEIYV